VELEFLQTCTLILMPPEMVEPETIPSCYPKLRPAEFCEVNRLIDEHCGELLGVYLAEGQPRLELEGRVASLMCLRCACDVPAQAPQASTTTICQQRGARDVLICDRLARSHIRADRSMCH
jgi:hypothetical protein